MVNIIVTEGFIESKNTPISEKAMEISKNTTPIRLNTMDMEILLIYNPKLLSLILRFKYLRILVAL